MFYRVYWTGRVGKLTQKRACKKSLIIENAPQIILGVLDTTMKAWWCVAKRKEQDRSRVHIKSHFNNVTITLCKTNICASWGGFHWLSQFLARICVTFQSRSQLHNMNTLNGELNVCLNDIENASIVLSHLWTCARWSKRAQKAREKREEVITEWTMNE